MVVNIPQNRRAFTLIELLVVVSIIAILIALLLPALGRARVVGIRVRCASQFQQLGVAHALYMENNAQVFPYHRKPLGPGARPSPGLTRIRELAAEASGPAPDLNEETWFTLIFEYGDTDKLYRCPDIQAGSFAWGFTAHDIGYGQNSYFLGQMPGRQGEQAGDLPSGYEVPLDSVKAPSMCLNLADSGQRSDGVWSLSLWWPYINAVKVGVTNQRHDNTANVLFVDTHVEVIGDPDSNINPRVDNTPEFIEYWDPQQRRDVFRASRTGGRGGGRP